MEFSEYTKSLFTNKTGEEIKLTDAERSVLCSYLVDKSIIGLLGTKLSVASTSKANVVFLKNQDQTWKDKEAPGPGEFQKPNFDPVTINWLKPKMQSVAFTEADLQLGLPSAASTKLAAAATSFAKNFERHCWKELETKLNTLASQKIIKDLSSLDGKAAYVEIMNLANKLLELKNEKEGLDGVSKDDIIIFVKPSILTKISLAGLVGNMAQTAFLAGKYGISTLGGYTIVENPYLSKADVIVATNFTAASMKHINAANIATLAPTNDIGMYFEAMGLFGLVYSSTMYGYFKA